VALAFDVDFVDVPLFPILPRRRRRRRFLASTDVSSVSQSRAAVLPRGSAGERNYSEISINTQE
jgi:hypothetical protein